MGKDLKGKEIGTGLCQKENGVYNARIKLKNGTRPEKDFEKLTDAKRWLNEMRFKNENNVYATKDISVDTWYEYWIRNYKKGQIDEDTIEAYERRYMRSVSPKIGNMLIRDVRPIHCQEVMNDMDSLGLKCSTQRLTRTVLGAMFKAAYENDYILKNPVISSVKIIKKDMEDDVDIEDMQISYLSTEEQKLFVEFVDKVTYKNCFLLLLQTGLRRGELLGLTWEKIDFVNKEIYVTRQIKYKKGKGYYFAKPKNKKSRIIPLTNEAERILKEQLKKWREYTLLGKSPMCQNQKIVFFNLIGDPIFHQTLLGQIKIVCRKAKIPEIKIHALRHTFATRCIENGMRPKTLQILLGHSSIKITMDLYVHVSKAESRNELLKIQSYI